MKILRAITCFTPSRIYGGPVTGATQQSEGLAKRHHTSTIVSSDVLQLGSRERIPVATTPVPFGEVRHFRTRDPVGWLPLLYSRDLGRWVRAHVDAHDVVHVHLSREAIPIVVARAAIDRGVPLYVQTHGMLGTTGRLRRTVDRMLIRNILESARAVFSLTPHEDAELRAISHDARIVRLPNGTELPRSDQLWSSHPQRQNVLFVSRLHPRKRVLAFVEMAEALLKRDLGWSFRIVGPDGGDLEVLRRAISASTSPAAYDIVGPVERSALTEHYRWASVYVMPADNEPWGHTLIDALKLGVPSVANSNGHIVPHLAEAGTCLAVNREVADMADAVERIGATPARAEDMSRRAVDYVRSHLGLSRVLDILEREYAGGRPDA